MSKRRKFKDTWPQIAGVDEHLARTGEKPPGKWCDTPADMLNHGGYGAISRDGRKVLGPFCWYENAARAAGAFAGLAVRWIDHESVVESLRSAWAEQRRDRRRRYFQRWRAAHREQEIERLRAFRRNRRAFAA